MDSVAQRIASFHQVLQRAITVIDDRLCSASSPCQAHCQIDCGVWAASVKGVISSGKIAVVEQRVARRCPRSRITPPQRARSWRLGNSLPSMHWGTKIPKEDIPPHKAAADGKFPVPKAIEDTNEAKPQDKAATGGQHLTPVVFKTTKRTIPLDKGGL